MSESEAESVEAVEVEPPKKKTRPPMSEERRKQMLENLAKGRKARAENLSNKRLEKEQEQMKKEQEHKCDYCGSQFKYRASKTKHMKTCKENPNNKVEVEDKPLDLPVKENVKVERKENEIEEPPEMKEEKKKKKKKVIYVSDDSSSEEEIVYKKKKSKRQVVYMNEPAPAPQRPLITEAQKQAIMKKRAEEARYAEMGRKQEANANRIKQLSANMLRKNRF